MLYCNFIHQQAVVHLQCNGCSLRQHVIAMDIIVFSQAVWTWISQYSCSRQWMSMLLTFKWFQSEHVILEPSDLYLIISTAPLFRKSFNVDNLMRNSCIICQRICAVEALGTFWVHNASSLLLQHHVHPDSELSLWFLVVIWLFVLNLF